MSEQYLEFFQDQHYFLRHLFARRSYTSQKNISRHEVYLRKRNSRIARQNTLRNSAQAREFFNWVWSIQIRLRWTNSEFALALGVSLQTLKLWRNHHGHFPSRKSLKRLLELDLYASRIEVRKINYGITTTSTIVRKNHV